MERKVPEKGEANKMVLSLNYVSSEVFIIGVVLHNLDISNIHLHIGQS